MRPSKKKIPYLLFLIFLAIPLLLVRINEDFVVFSDELIYEEISYRMAKTGDFLTPILQGEVWLTKPPLYFWLTAPFYKFFSPLPWVRRVWSVVPAFFLIITTYFLARLIFRPLTAFLAGLILLTNYHFFVFTKAGNLDILSTLLLSLSLYTYLRYQKKWFWPIMAAVAFGLAILTRSFLALSLLPLVGIDLLFHKQSSPGKDNNLILLLPIVITQKIIAWRKTSRLEFFLIGWLFVFSLVFVPLLISRTAYAWFFYKFSPPPQFSAPPFFPENPPLSFSNYLTQKLADYQSFTS